MNIANIINTVCLITVCFACVFHMTSQIEKDSSHVERWGFVLTCAGSFGQVVYIYWPKIVSFPFDMLTNVGICLIALMFVRGRYNAPDYTGLHFHFRERRTVPRHGPGD